MRNVIYNARVILPDRILENGYLIHEDGIIVSVGEGKPRCSDGVDARGKYLSAGFVDIHCHGGGDSDFNDGGVDSFKIPAKLHAEHGTTTLVPTITTGPVEDVISSFESFKEAKNSDDGARLVGIHMEGPYLSVEQAGAQDPRYIRAPKKEDYEYITREADGCIIRWTFAPELEGAEEFSAYLKKNGILPSIGHSNAVYADVERAFNSGADLLTHFYSGMSSITRVDGYRRLGVIESGYVIDGMRVEVIADGHHLPRELLLMIYKFKGADNIALVTDSMRGAGMPDGDTVLGNRETGLHCIIEGGVAKLPDRTAFAGSVCTTDRLVRTMYKTVGVSITDAVKMMTETPARLINMENEIGTLEIGKRADLVIFDDDINVEMTVVGGKTVYKK